MGFYLTTVIHQVFKPEPAAIIDLAINYLNSFIDYGLWLRSSRRPNFHLESISLVGPAIASLFLFQLKAGAPIDEKRFAFVEEPWFKTDHPTSYDDIQKHLKVYQERQKELQANAAAISVQPSLLTPLDRILKRLGS
jgi:hypothetical protein